MSNRTVIILILALVTFLCIVITLRFYSPVLFALYEAGDPSKQPYLVILNPLRDRSPENISENFLNKLSSGDCPEALKVFLLDEKKQVGFCDKESENRFNKWTLINRSDGSSSSKLIYEVNNVVESSFTRRIILTTTRTGDEWKIDGIDTFY